ncbi:2-hydroxyacid dehydrogenase [Ochrobactrum sp. EDr1-4]|uniref:2-hydroxyacid dehydrogenase n=1 Tax=Ochrobactrum sp. EDr1-4 TaxID=3368622 RepID=UPI003B9F657D
MSKPQILLMGAYPEWDLADLEAQYQVHKVYEAQDRDAFIAEHAPEIRAIATRGELGASASLMKSLPKLEIVSCYGVGTDAIDLEHARGAGIRVTNTPDVLTADVADQGVALLLATARKLPQGDRFVRDGKWTKGNMELVTRVSGKRVGVVGFGRIGAAVAKRLAAFDCDVAYFSRSQRDGVACPFFQNLLEMAKWSEFLIVTLSGGNATRNIIDGAVLEALGEQGILVNVSRGSTVDEAALLTALEGKTIKGAGLDVFLNEPNIDERFFALDNVVLQPHHGSGTLETRQAMGKLVRDNLTAHFAGSALLTPVV